jgi:hypothetical protein
MHSNYKNLFRKALMAFGITGLLTAALLSGGQGIPGTNSAAGLTQSAEVSWIPSPDTNLVSYNLYYGVASGIYTNETSVGDVTNVTVAGLVDGTTYYFAATAVNEMEEESDFSAETSYFAPPESATLTSAALISSGFSFSVNGIWGYSYVIQSSIDLVNWYPIATNTAPFVFVDPNTSQNGQKFYLAVYYSAAATNEAAFAPTATASNDFSFTISGSPGDTHMTQASTNLVARYPIATTIAPFLFGDPN